mgnify:CR=1 FL=1
MPKLLTRPLKDKQKFIAELVESLPEDAFTMVNSGKELDRIKAKEGHVIIILSDQTAFKRSAGYWQQIKP